MARHCPSFQSFSLLWLFIPTQMLPLATEMLFPLGMIHSYMGCDAQQKGGKLKPGVGPGGEEQDGFTSSS